MLSVGIAQIANSTDVSKNFEAIFGLLQKFEKAKVDVVLFPECSLSGFTSKIRECTEALLKPYIERIQSWAQRTGIEVVLPTAIVESDKIFNSGFWFKGNESERFYKIGLTDSEKKFFSVPSDVHSKVFKTKGIQFYEKVLSKFLIIFNSLYRKSGNKSFFYHLSLGLYKSGPLRVHFFVIIKVCNLIGPLAH